MDAIGNFMHFVGSLKELIAIIQILVVCELHELEVMGFLANVRPDISRVVEAEDWIIFSMQSVLNPNYV